LIELDLAQLAAIWKLRRNTYFYGEEKWVNGFGRFFCREFLAIGRVVLALFGFFAGESFESCWGRIGLITFGFLL
jgi:hypothetical protein